MFCDSTAHAFWPQWPSVFVSNKHLEGSFMQSLESKAVIAQVGGKKILEFPFLLFLLNSSVGFTNINMQVDASQ